MDKKTYYYSATVIFSALAVLHVLRAYYEWEAMIDGVVIPIWFSWVAAAIGGYLAVRGWQFANNKR